MKLAFGMGFLSSQDFGFTILVELIAFYGFK